MKKCEEGQIKSKEKISKKKILLIIISLLIILFLLFIIISALPYILFVLTMLYEIFIHVPDKPKVEKGEFPFELVYEYKGEQFTIKDSIICEYKGYSFSLEGGNSNDWECEFKTDKEYGHYYIDEENIPDLYIVVPDAPDYYMGDKEATKEFAEPYIHYIDESSGTYYEEREKIDIVDIKIIEWKSSNPLENNFK